MILKTIVTASILTGGTVTISGMLLQGTIEIIKPYLPFLVGGISLYVWLVVNEEEEFGLRQSMSVVVSAVILGWLTSGLIIFFGELIFNGIVSTVPDSWTKETYESEEIIANFAQGIGFGLGVFSRLILDRLFRRRKRLIGKLEKKVLGSNDDNNE